MGENICKLQYPKKNFYLEYITNLKQKENPTRAFDIKRHLTKEDIQTGNKHMKMCSTLLTIR